MEKINFCRYFGESRSVPVDPEEAKIYHYEQKYMSCYYAEDSSHLLDEEMDWYEQADLSHFCKNDSIPYSLKAHLYVSYRRDHENSTPESFKEWYKQHYLRHETSGKGGTLAILLIFCAVLLSPCNMSPMQCALQKVRQRI